MKITLGYCGLTDCCLVLNNGNQSKEYAIGSEAWRILNEYWNIPEGGGEIPNAIGLEIWENNDKDIL